MKEKTYKQKERKKERKKENVRSRWKAILYFAAE